MTPTIDYSLPGCTCALGGMGRRANCPCHGERSGFTVNPYPKEGQVIDVGGTLWRVTEVRHEPNGRLAFYGVVDLATGRYPNAFSAEEVRNR